MEHTAQSCIQIVGTGKSTQVVAKLIYYLYGQKDAARAWMASVMAFFDSIGAVPLVSDRMAFRWEHDGEEMNVAVHVDDFVATPSSESIRALQLVARCHPVPPGFHSNQAWSKSSQGC